MGLFKSVGGAFDTQAIGAINTFLSRQGILTQGNVFWVKPYSGNDGRDGLDPSSAVQHVEEAFNRCVSGQNDVVALCAENNTAAQTTSYLSQNLAWSKDLVHLVGVNGGPLLGQRSRIAPLATATVFADLFTLSGNGCLISGVEFFQGQMATNPTAASTCLKVTGQRNHIYRCQVSGIGHSDLDDAGSNSLTLSGSENLFEGCYIGLNTVIRATATAEVVISGGARNTFLDCLIDSYTSGSTFKAVSVNAACDRWIKFTRCEFNAVQNITSAVAPTGAIGITTMNGSVLVKDHATYGYAQLVTANNAYVLVLSTNGVNTGLLLGVAQAVKVS